MKKIISLAVSCIVLFVCCEREKEETDHEFEHKITASDLPGVYLSANHYSNSGYGRICYLKEDGTFNHYYFFDSDLSDGVDIENTTIITGTWNSIETNQNIIDNVKSDMAVVFETVQDDEVLYDTNYLFSYQGKSFAYSTYFGVDEFEKYATPFETIIKKLPSIITTYTAKKDESKALTPAPAYLSSWMSQLPDDIYLRDLSIPGAHDALSYRCSHSAQMQTENVLEQFKWGVRFFDCRYYMANFFGKKVYPCHGNIGLCMNLFRTIRTELERIEQSVSGTRECAIICFKHDRSKQDDDDKRFCRKWLEENAINKSIYIPFNKDLKLGDVRGKIVLVYRGSEWNNKPGYNAFTYMQDDYSFAEETDYVTQKTTVFKQYVDMRADIDPKLEKGSFNSEWMINHCSGYVYNNHNLLKRYQPVLFTHKVYGPLYNILQNTKGKTFGVVPMDFVGRNDNVVESIRFFHSYKVETKPLLERIVKSNNEVFLQ